MHAALPRMRTGKEISMIIHAPQLGLFEAFICELPRPPSVNSLFRNPSRKDGKRIGRIKTKEYQAWAQKAGWLLLKERAPKLDCAYELTIALGRRKGSDLDNYAKAVSDLLVSLKVVRDDSDCERLVLEWADDLAAARCRITLAPCRNKSSTIARAKG